MSETRYDWLVDGQPTQNRYTVLGDITGSIQISMDFKPTFTTEKRGTLTIAFVNMSTYRTLLRSIPGIDGNNLLTKILGFIPDKLFQFKERPVIQLPIKFGSSSFLDADLRQVFKRECGKWRLNNLLRDAMIDISHKPSFSTGQLLKFPFGRSSAFGLQFGSEMRKLRSGILHSRRIEKCVVGTDCNVDNTPINPKNRSFRNKFQSIRFKLAVQIKRIIVLTKRQRRRFGFPCQILPVIFRNTKHGSDSTIGCCNGSIPRSQKHVDNTGIIPHCRILFTERFKLTFHRFQRFASNISRTLYQRGWEIGNGLSNIVIGSIMAVNFTNRMGFETPCGTDVKCHGIIPHGFQERIARIRRNIQFQLNCPNHIHILYQLEYITFGGGRCEAISLVTEVTSFLAPRS